MAARIVLKKNEEYFSTEEEALQALRNIIFQKGEPAVAIYGKTEEDARVILAIGKDNGVGDSCFDVIATTQSIDNISSIINSLENSFSSHELLLANGDTVGHVKSSNDITFTDGGGIVNSAGKVKNKLIFQGGSTGEFDGSNKVTINIPLSSNETPKINSGSGSPGTKNDWSRADHVHPEQINISGNSGTTTKFQNPKSITIKGAVNGNVRSDFSGDVVINTTLSDHTHSISQITDLTDELNNKAPINNPVFTGVPQAPTASKGTNTKQLATTEFVIAEIQDKIQAAIALRFKGTIGNGGTITELPSSHTTGDVYLSLIGAPNVGDEVLEPGDLIICIKDGSVKNDSDWTVVQTNIDGAVVGPSSCVNNNIPIFNGNTGKLIKDSGLSLSNLAKTSIAILPGKGLVGGGDLGSTRTLSHQDKPSSGNDAGGSGSFVTTVKIDDLGHVVETSKVSLSGSVTAESGKYISSVNLSGTKLSGTTSDLPRLSITGGEEISNNYVTGISVNDHSIKVTKSQLIIPNVVISNGEKENNKYISSITSEGHNITVSKTSLPEESGKVKVTANGPANYLSEKIKTVSRESNTYPINIEHTDEDIKLGVTIDKIDGSVSDIISKIIPDSSTPNLSNKGEIGIKFSNDGTYGYLYSNSGNSTIRLYPNATETLDGLMSKEDKVRLNNLEDSTIGGIDNKITELSNKVNQEIINRENADTQLSTKIDETNSDLEEKINNLDVKIDNLGIVKSIQLGTNKELLYPSSDGNLIISEVSGVDGNPPGLMNNADKIKLDKIIFDGTGESFLSNSGYKAIQISNVYNLNSELSSIKSSIEKVKNTIGTSEDGSLPSLSGTNYLNGKTTIIDCLKALDSQIKLISDKIDSHISNSNNPHNVTRDQLSLGESNEVKFKKVSSTDGFFDV